MKNSQPQSFRETNQKKKEAQIRYSGRFVKESFGDKFVVAPGDSFSKTWVFRNDGKTAWSMNTQFIQTNGDDLGAQVPVALTKSVESETEHTWEVQMKAPEKEGLYTAYFRMQI